MCTDEDLEMEENIKKRILTSNPLFVRAKSELGKGFNLISGRRHLYFQYGQKVKSNKQSISPSRHFNFSVNEKSMSNNDSEEDILSREPALNLPHMCMQVKQKQNLEKLLQVSKRKVKQLESKFRETVKTMRRS